MLHRPAWLRDIVLEVDEDGCHVLVRLHRDDRWIQACVPEYVNDVLVVARVA